MNRKTNPKHWLYTLTEDRAAVIADYARTHTLRRTVVWLAKDGLKTSRSALGKWLARWKLRQRFRAAESNANEYRDWLAKSFPRLSQRELDRRAGLIFQLEAVESGDARTYLAFATSRHRAKMDKARLDQRERAMTHDREKWLAAQRTKIEAGLDALYLEVKDNAQARELFQKFKAVATTAAS